MKNIVIYGANSQIAQEFILSSNPKDYSFFLFSKKDIKNEEKLKNKGYQIVCFKGDISKVDDMHAFLEDNFSNRAIDLMINCAGVMHVNYLKDLPYDKLDEMLRVNVKGLVNTYYLSSPYLKENKSTLIYLGSTAGYESYPGGVTYCASKAFLNSFVRGIRNELEYTGKQLNIHIISPGPVKTKFTEVENIPKKLKLLEPADISNQIHYLIKNGNKALFTETRIQP